jgi:Trk K+ transport system NAD-binding subunit
MDSEIEGKRIKDIKWPSNCLVVAITRGYVEILPNGSTEILAGDYITFMTDQSDSSEVLEKVTKLSQR